MGNYFTRNVVAVGFVAGLGMAAVSTLLLWLDQGKCEIIVQFIDFLAGLPVVIARRLDVPKSLFYPFFFTYWGLTGASIAKLVQRRRPRSAQ